MIYHCNCWTLGARCCRCQSNDDNPDGECDLAPDEKPEPCQTEGSRT